MENNCTFLYFAYGSNLLKERLQLRNPSAMVNCVAMLKDYKLVFGNYKGLANDRWHGGVATIEHSPGDEMWGVVWRMNMSDLESLDSQENVTLGAYNPVDVSVNTKGQELNCRTYIMYSCVYAPPSPHYLQVRDLSLHQCLWLRALTVGGEIPYSTIPITTPKPSTSMCLPVLSDFASY
ncbi:gamma-glutamylcyclotransferase b isoform X2 [Hippoglossus hippoglossus]|uniref:gamma-glutamylcyclotransferase b isoform X2 n=1 Tax=Hippoglossus hippoglossus TaxID=8267 RepID=UPI00148B98CF|nr:gamma-glutamylcyclotransferase b isoform X2 [Hippoglossus hippoglossus]